jgi:hypothetical protein
MTSTASWSVRLGACLVLASTIVIDAGCRALPRQRPIQLGETETGPGSLSDIRRQLEGRWELVSARARNTGGQLVPVEARGSLTYDAFGNFESTGEIVETPGVTLAGDVFAQKGRAVLNLDTRRLWIRPEKEAAEDEAEIPFQVSPDEIRRFEVSSDALTLTTEDETGAPVLVLSYQRLQ